MINVDTYNDEKGVILLGLTRGQSTDVVKVSILYLALGPDALEQSAFTLTRAKL